MAEPPPLPRSALLQLLGDMQDDLADYSVLAVLQERQHDGALRQDAALLEALAHRIVVLVDRLEARRSAREALIGQLLGEDEPACMDALLARMPATGSAPLQALWGRVGHAVSDCRSRNARNLQLMTDQQDLMRRVLVAEAQAVYAGV
ncbi:flagellar protein FlgN [Pseudorhodoferax sp. Leaf267]|uniref:flagellar protein FlgN n=1 Tax=Pseudorhodoferax sp. Leaf267 TaxID=1736316 RepID=UPI0006FBA473|nr:flagellar protein FlgN [Pseudorhodoferax sp. Leaf267]KQP15130.1 hypothetical protein ASF43_13965 [Pseudorhodoferax sp. Leaf267]